MRCLHREHEDREGYRGHAREGCNSAANGSRLSWISTIPRSKMLAEVRMKFRVAAVCLTLALTIASAGDGIPPRGSAEDYPAHQVSGKIAIGAAYVPPSQVKKLFGEDLEKHGWVVFEVGVFPVDATQTDVSADDFKLRQGKDLSVERAATPHTVAADVHPRKSSQQPPVPSKVNVQTTDTIGYEKGPYGQRGVYTGTEVGVGVGTPPNAPPPPPAASGGNDQLALEQQLEEKSLPETKTKRAVAGYVYFPKPSGDKRADFELIYLGRDGEISLKLSLVSKP